MDVDFIIPLKKEDLITSSENCYSVKLIPFEQAATGIGDLRFSIERTGCNAIVENFDRCFSFLYDAEDCPLSQMQEFYDDVVEEYMKRLCCYCETALSSDPSEKKTALNVVKMICYTFSLFIKTYEERLSRQCDNLIAEPKRNRTGKGKSKNKPENVWPWYNKKSEAFSCLLRLLKLPLCDLWPSRTMEETMVNLIAGCSFKVFENGDINLVKCKALRDCACQVLAEAVANYSYMLTFLPKSVEVMKQHEQSAVAIAHSVLAMHREYHCPTILEKLLEELLDACEEDVQTLGKPAASFISELGESNPDLFLTCVDTLGDFLFVDNYLVRNAVLVTYCEMVLHCFADDKLTKEVRNSVLKDLQSSMHDENAFVRSKVIQLWNKLALASCISTDSYVPLLREALFRLTDKSTQVSKNTIVLFTTVLEHNPYGGKLRLNDVNKEKEVEVAKLRELMEKKPLPPEKRWSLMESQIVLCVTTYFEKDQELNGYGEEQDLSNIEIGHVIIIIASLIRENCFDKALSLLLLSETVFPDCREMSCNTDKADRVGYYVACLKKIYLRATELNPQAIVPEYYDNINKMESLRTVVKFLSTCADFIECINKASNIIYKLMFSTNISEILESVEFFSKAYKFQIENSERAVQDMLHLLNADSLEVRDAVSKAYSSLYLESSKTDPVEKAAQISQRLINLVKGIDRTQKLALEDLLHKWLKDGELGKEFVSVLFEKILQTSDGKANLDSKASLVLLEIVARQNNCVIYGNLSHLKALSESDLDNTTLQLLASLYEKLCLTKKNNKPVKYKKENIIFEYVTRMLLEKFTSKNESEYNNMAASVIDLIFKLCYKPEDLGNEILHKLSEKMKESVESKVRDKNEMSEILLERLIFVFGHTVFRRWQYCDRDVFNLLKKCQEGGTTVNKGGDESIDEMEAEQDNLVAADDALYETITSCCEALLTEPGTLVFMMSDLVVKVCQSADDKLSPSLKASAALALAKLMLTSASFCETHFQLYMTLMDRSKHKSVRSNLVLCFGDLLCRFPNTAEPWTPYLYSRLKDSCHTVRLNAVTVLCHLISIGMIKVGGQFAEILIHMDDPNPVICEKVNSLLLDLSMKGNTIYNVIPDIISNLSDPERSDSVASSTFQLIVKRLFELITKERQSGLLVEKLCSRLKESSHERQWNDLAFCLAQIKYSEKTLRKIMDALPTLNERLAHQEVHDTILNIISTCSISTKPSLKELAHEASSLLEELMTGRSEDQGSPDKEKENNTPDSSKGDKDPDETATTPVKSKLRTRENKKGQSELRRNAQEKRSEATPSRKLTRSTRKRVVRHSSEDETD